jgi:cystathionine beta-lyase/cystathionine gamma-synthase
MNTVTKYINDAHLKTNSTLGNCSDIEMYGDPLTPSINNSSAYAFKSIDELGAYHENKFNSFRYARDSSLIGRQLEYYFELMHGGRKSLVFNSGMSAISAVFSSLVTSNTTIITFGSFYRKSLSIFESYQKLLGINYINLSNLSDLASYSSEEVIVLIESPSNPFLKIVDVSAVREALPTATLILDTTFQGLVNSKTNYEDVDLIVASCTKYIGGHNDLLAGLVACRNEELYSLLWNERSMRGGNIDNYSASLLLRSLRTYDLRIGKTLDNTSKILEYLNDQQSIESIYYPGSYDNSDQKELFDREYYHGGGVVTFRVNERINIKNNIATLCSIKMAPSFGSVDSLIEIPAYMSHWGKSVDDLAKLDLDHQTVRFSVGNEPVDYILNDLERLVKK